MQASPPREPEVNKLFRLAGHYKADLYLHVGLAPMLRVRGVTRESVLQPLSQHDLEHLLLPILSAEQGHRLDREEEVTFTYVCAEYNFRVSVSKNCGQLRLSARWLEVA